MTAALAYIQVTALSRAAEPEARVAFYFALASAVLGAIGIAIHGASSWHWPSSLPAVLPPQFYEGAPCRNGAIADR